MIPTFKVMLPHMQTPGSSILKSSGLPKPCLVPGETVIGYMDVQSTWPPRHSGVLPDRFDSIQLRSLLYVPACLMFGCYLTVFDRRRGGGYILSKELCEYALQILLEHGLGEGRSSDALETYTTSRSLSEEEYSTGKATIEATKSIFDSMLESAVRYHLCTTFLSRYG